MTKLFITDNPLFLSRNVAVQRWCVTESPVGGSRAQRGRDCREEEEQGSPGRRVLFGSSADLWT